MTTAYNHTKYELLNAWLSSATVRVALVSDNTAYTPDIDAEQYVDDVLDGGTTAEEFDDPSYSRQPLTGVSITQDNTDDEGVFDADNVTFSSLAGGTVQGVLVYVQEGGDDTTPADDPLLGFFDGGDYPKAANGSDFVVEWAGEGLLNVT